MFNKDNILKKIFNFIKRPFLTRIFSSRRSCTLSMCHIIFIQMPSTSTLNEDACSADNQPQIIELPGHFLKQEPDNDKTPMPERIVQMQTFNNEQKTVEQQPNQVVEHHVVHIQSENGLQQLQIETAPGQNIELQDIIAALEQGQAIAVQDSSGLPAGSS
jgi:hypothetical protein